MALVVFSTLTMLTIIYFAVNSHQLNKLELAMVFLIITYLNSNYLDIVFLNFERIEVNKEPGYILAFYTNALLLCPFVITWGIDRYFGISSFSKKTLMTLSIMLVLLGLEYLAEWLKTYHYEKWSWWQSLIKWLAIWLVAIFGTKLFSKILLKELRQ